MTQPPRTLLIVDDSPEDRELYRRYLARDREYDYTILEASLGQEGLELWREHQPDVVLLDYRLPDLDGLEFLSRLQPDVPEVPLPIIVLTGEGNEAIAVQAMKAGAQDYLVKGQLTPEGLQLGVNGAIAAVELRLQLQQRIERERVIAQITQQMHRSLNLDDILQTGVTEVRQFLQTDRVLVFRLHPDGHGTVVAEAVGSEWQPLLTSTIYDPCLAENYLRFSRPGSITHDPAFAEDYVRRYRQGQVTAIDNIHASGIDPCHIELLASFQVQANLVVPILHDEQFWGLLIAHHCAAPRLWESLEIDLLKELATQLSIALRQAELYDQVQRELAERKQTEAALQESEERLRVALNASRMGTWDWNIQTGTITWSENLEGLFGLEPGAFDGSYEMFVSRLHPDDRDRVLSDVQQAITTGEAYDTEFRVVYPNSTVRWALSQGKVFYDDNGQAVRMAGIDIDITERKHAAEILRDSEERFRQLAENIDAVFWIKEKLEDRVSYVSPAYERLWGLDPQELYDRPLAWVDHIHPDDREWSFNAFQSKAAVGGFDEEYRIVLADGSIRWVHDRCFPLQDEAGNIYRFAGIAEDITDRKRVEKALRKSEERFRTSVENMLDCFGIYQAIRNEQGQIVDFRIEYVNDAACLNNLMSREEQVGQGLCELLPGHRDSELFDAYCQVVETGQPLVKDSLVYEDNYGQQRLSRAFDIRIAKLGDGFIATWRDITDRMQTKLRLQESEARLKLAHKATQSGLWDWDVVRNVATVSEEYCALLGFDPSVQAVSFEEWLSRVHPDDRVSASEGVRESIQHQQQYYTADYRIVHPDGIRWIAARGQVFYDAAGAAVRVLGNVQDITDRKQAEELLRQSEEFKRRMLDSSSDCIKLLDINGQLLYMNTGGLCLLEIDDFTPYQNMPWASFWQADDRDTVEAAITAARTGELGRFQGFCPTAKGTPRWWDVIVTPIFDTRGQVEQILATSRDITDRKEAEESLLRSEERYRTLFESMEDGFCVIEMLFDESNTPIDYRFLEANPAFEQQTGLEQAVGKTMRQLVPELEGHWFETYGRVVLTGEPVRFDDGSEAMNRWFDVYAFRIGSPDDHKVAILFKDVSDRRLAEQERERLLVQEQVARAEAERANRIKDEFLAVLSHELRSPLNPILGWTQLLQTRTFDPANTAKALATIERNAKLQTQLIDDLLDMAKILRGKFTMNAVPVDLVFVIESAIDTMRTAAVAKAILLDPVLPNIGPVHGDAARLQQIVWNLLSNAIKFTPCNGRIDIRLERVGNQAQLTVSDTGKGIDPNFLPHIFESFRQEDVSITRQYGGLGLGLAIVRSLVEAHGGTITASSPGNDQGATFTVQLPLLNVVLEGEQPEILAEQDLDLTGIRILTVDDDPDARDLLNIILTQYGAEVLTVNTAAEVLANLELFRPDVLVSDIGMPGVDGYTLIQQIRTLPPEKGGQILAIALTAYAREDDYQRAIASGYQRHITKPLEPERLVQAVVLLLHSQRTAPSAPNDSL